MRRYCDMATTPSHCYVLCANSSCRAEQLAPGGVVAFMETLGVPDCGWSEASGQGVRVDVRRVLGLSIVCPAQYR